MTKNEFIEEIAKAVKKYAPEFGITVYSPIIAQACLESAYGTSYKAQRNNFFGLKYRKNRVSCYNGFFYDDGSEQKADGTYIPINTAWYMFSSLELGVKGYFEFLNIDRYKNLKGITEPEEYLRTIKEDGYATSLNYVQNLMRVIETNNLTRFDREGEKEEMSNKFKVHIDPGHQTDHYNRSTTNENYYESNMTWKLANYLKSELESRGITVTLSRQFINENPSLYNRGYGAKGCDLFLSLHSNACGTESVDYPVVYRAYDKTIADDFALKLANLIHNLMGTKQAGRTATRTGKNGEYYGVLRGARAAGLTYYYIVEHSFHTNANATNWLLNDNNLRTLAKKEAELIASYFNVKNNQPETIAPVKPETITRELYRVRKSWSDSASQIGAYSILENAKKNCPDGYSVYDSKGNVVYSKNTSYIVQITATTLNVRSGAGTNYKVTTQVKKNQKYTIVEEKNGWGRLKSGAGWISLKYTKKV